MYARFWPESDYTMGVNISAAFLCSRPNAGVCTFLNQGIVSILKERGKKTTQVIFEPLK